MYMRVLLIDTCGESAGVALCKDGVSLRGIEFSDRGASAGIVAAVRELLAAEGWKATELDGVGVVNGPGSFTGVRAGVAAAKGLCEATGLKPAAVSRLAVLCEAADMRKGFAVLRAGRDEFYVRDAASGREWMSSQGDFMQQAEGHAVIVSEKSVWEVMSKLRPQLLHLYVEDAIDLVEKALRDGGIDVAQLDANYVRGESEIYKKAGASR